MFSGAEMEAEFGPLSAAFGVMDVWALVAIWHGGSWVKAAPEGAVDKAEERGAEAPLFHVSGCVG